MYKFAYKIFSITLAIFFVSGSAFALNAEFKNTLMKIEVIKTSEANYNIDLYTKNKFSEPVKVIKKSDLNYYVLLPETKNESNRTITQGVDIRNISTNVYPYAGQDVNNGYVKININTTKPINFKVNVKNPVAAATIDTKVAQAILEEKQENKIEKKQTTQVQKKNSDFSISKKQEPVKKETTIKKEPVQKYEPPKIEDAVAQEVERYREETIQEVDQELANLEKELPLLQNQELINKEDLREIEQITYGKKKNSCFCEKIKNFKNKLSNKLTQYGFNLTNILLLFLALIFAPIVIFAISMKKEKNQVHIKRKIELNDALYQAEKTEEELQEQKNDGQFFIFDKNIKQTGFCDPATSAIKRNYELSSYEPELRNKYNRNHPFRKNNENEYDIIQKILKEDSFIDLPNGSFEQQVRTAKLKTDATPKNKISTEKAPIEPKKEEVKKEVVQNIEPIVLSNVEIAPQRGFMLVSYNDNINLLGYIFDDVFALYDFKQTKLEKYDIKYRLSEKDDKTARFIVKVDNVKVLIAVNKTQMALEVVL